MIEVEWTREPITIDHDEHEALFRGVVDGVFRFVITVMRYEGHPLAVVSRTDGFDLDPAELQEGLRHAALHFGLDMGLLMWECKQEEELGRRMFSCRAHGPEICDHEPDEVEAWHPEAPVHEGSERTGKAS